MTDQPPTKIEQRLARVEQTLGTLIAWTAQSYNSSINPSDAEKLLKMLQGDQET